MQERTHRLRAKPESGGTQGDRGDRGKEGDTEQRGDRGMLDMGNGRGHGVMEGEGGRRGTWEDGGEW